MQAESQRISGFTCYSDWPAGVKFSRTTLIDNRGHVPIQDPYFARVELSADRLAVGCARQGAYRSQIPLGWIWLNTGK
jgi:hypothetical protein